MTLSREKTTFLERCLAWASTNGCHLIDDKMTGYLKLNITTREWRRLFLWAALVTALTCVPALVGWLNSSVEWYYTGLTLSPADGNTYLNKMRQGYAGAWLFTIAYTAEPHEPTFLHPYYLLLGHIARLIGLPLGLTFQLARSVNGFLLLLTVYVFLAILWPQPRKRMIGFWFVTLSSGLGWLFVFLNIPTTDLRVPESVTFSTLLVNPHFPLATALVIAALLLGVWALYHCSWAAAILAGLCQAALLMLHPYDIVITGLTLGLLFLLGWLLHRHWPWQRGVYLAVGWLICLPVFWHNLNLYTRDGVWRLWQTQSPPPTPPLLDFILGYGLLLLLALVGGSAIIRCDQTERSGPIQLTLIWAIGIPVLMFAPIPPLEAIQVRFSEGLHLPISILAVEGLYFLTARWRKLAAPSAWVWLPLLLFLALTNGLLLLGMMWRMGVPKAPWFYRHDDIAVMQWLNAHGQPNDVVLSLEWSGNHLPTQANVRVYVGHLYETIDYVHKTELTGQFFNGSPKQDEAAKFLQANGIDWVFAGRQETEAGFSANNRPYLVPAFSVGQATVYRVRTSQ